MICKKCGHYNSNPIFYPVNLSRHIAIEAGDEVPVLEPILRRWPCEKCGRFHFPDGSLYSKDDALEMIAASRRQNQNESLSQDTNKAS